MKSKILGYSAKPINEDNTQWRLYSLHKDGTMIFYSEKGSKHDMFMLSTKKNKELFN